MSGKPTNPATDYKETSAENTGDRLLASGQFQRVAAWTSLSVGAIGISMAVWFLVKRQDLVSKNVPFFDILMLVTSAYAIFFGVRELVFYKKRALTLTASRVYGHDGRRPFDIPLLEVRSVSEETTRSFFLGAQTELVILHSSGRAVRMAQLKNRENLHLAIRQARDRAREAAARSLKA